MHSAHLFLQPNTSRGGQDVLFSQTLQTAAAPRCDVAPPPMPSTGWLALRRLPCTHLGNAHKHPLGILQCQHGHIPGGFARWGASPKVCSHTWRRQGAWQLCHARQHAAKARLGGTTTHRDTGRRIPWLQKHLHTQAAAWHGEAGACTGGMRSACAPPQPRATAEACCPDYHPSLLTGTNLRPVNSWATAGACTAHAAVVWSQVVGGDQLHAAHSRHRRCHHRRCLSPVSHQFLCSRASPHINHLLGLQSQQQLRRHTS